MFSENVDYVLLYRDHRTVAKAPTHNEKKAGQTVNVLRHLFQLYTAPDQSSLKPDTHDETFGCYLCMQLLCVPYTTVQTMQLHITCCSFPLQLCILFQHGAY